jgi:uncharacterized membrane protein
MAQRTLAFDWLRGLAVPLMIQCHALCLLWPHLRWSVAYESLVWLDGLVAPAFLIAAGFALALVLSRAQARPGQLGKSLRRALQILAAATAVNALWFPLLREPHWLYRLDILHCIGLSLLLVLLPLALLRQWPRVLTLLFWTMAACLFAISPLGEAVQGPWARLTNVQSGSLFPLLPWAGYAFLGAGLGRLHAARGGLGLLRGLIPVAAVAGLLWLLGPWLRGLYPPHQFRVTHPSEHARRIFLLALVLLGLLALEHRGRFAKTSVARVLAFLGRNSLVAYVFHEILLFYGVFGFSLSYRWGRRSDWWQYAVLTLGLSVVTALACVAAARLRDALWQPAKGRARVLSTPSPQNAYTGADRG